MSELRWRDREAGRDFVFPWSVPKCQLRPEVPMVKEFPEGRCVLFTDTFDDGTLAICLAHPGGAHYARFGPNPARPHDEAFEGEFPTALADELEEVWTSTIGRFADHALKLATSPKREVERG